MKKLVVWGTGSLAKRFLKEIDNKNMEIKYFIDNDSEKWGNDFQDYLILPPNKLLDKSDTVLIVVTSSYYVEIKNQLEQMGFKKFDDFISYEKYKQKFLVFINRELFPPLVRREKNWLESKICNQYDFDSGWFNEGLKVLNINYSVHRKLWEYSFIYSTLLENKMLQKNKIGIGFGVGKEPLVSAFASKGCNILATDLDFDTALKEGWVNTNQYSLKQMKDLNNFGICDERAFLERVKYKSVNMNDIPSNLHNGFDFTWSSCAFEHLGSIEKGIHFLIEQMRCLKHGGIAVHTTELNLSSNENTLQEGPTVLFRKKDIEEIVRQLTEKGYLIKVDFSLGSQSADQFVDLPPYSNNEHLRLLFSDYITTSIGLIIKKP